MATRTERRAAQRTIPQDGEQESQLTPEQEERLQEQLKGIATISSRSGSRLIDDYRDGQRCLQIEEEALWRKAKRHLGGEVLDYISERSKIPRATLEPRFIIARAFSIEKIEEAASRGACLTTMAEVGRGEPGLRGDLLEMALRPGSKGALFYTLRRARQTGNEHVRAHYKRIKKRAALAECLEAVLAEARAKMHRQMAESCERDAANKLRAAKKEAPCQRCTAEGGAATNGVKGGAEVQRQIAETPTSFLLREGEAVYKKALEARVEAEQAQKEAREMAEQVRLQGEAAAAQVLRAQEAAAQAQEKLTAAEREQATLAAREAALAERQAVLESGAELAQQAAAAGQPMGTFLLGAISQARDERDALRAEQKATAATIGEVEKARAEAEAMRQTAGEAEKRSALLEQTAAERALAAEKELSTAGDKRRQAEETLSEARLKGETMEQEKAQLAAQLAQAKEREAELARKELDLAERMHSMDVRDQALRTLEAQAGDKETDLVRREKELAERSFRVHQVALGKLNVDWKSIPNTLDEVMIFIGALSDKVTNMCRGQARKFLERDNGLEYSELEVVRNANRASILAREEVDKLIDEIIAVYQEDHAEEWDEFQERIRVLKEQEAWASRYNNVDDDDDDDDEEEDGDDDGGDDGDDGGDDNGGGGGTAGDGGGASGYSGGGRASGTSQSAAGSNPPAPATRQRLAAPPVAVHQDDTTKGGGATLEGAGPAHGPKVPVEVVIGSGKGAKKQWALLGLTKKGGGTDKDVDSNKSMKDAIEKHASTVGYIVSIDFVDVADKDTFKVDVDTDKWEVATNWSGGAPKGFAHELHHMLAFPLDRYDYTSHATNQSMEISNRVYWFAQELTKPAGYNNPMSIMNTNDHPNDDDACTVAGLLVADCVASRQKVITALDSLNKAYKTPDERVMNCISKFQKTDVNTMMAVLREILRQLFGLPEAANLAKRLKSKDDVLGKVFQTLSADQQKELLKIITP